MERTWLEGLNVVDNGALCAGDRKPRTCSVLIATGLRCGSVGWGAALWECRVGGCVLYLRWMAGGG